MPSEKFGIADKIIFEKRAEDYPPFVTLVSKQSHCKIALHGAHILSFIPHGSPDLLWLSSKALYQNDKAIRGGIPICWPWFGSSDKPSHGFARIHSWEVIRSGVDEEENPHITLQLVSNDASKKLFDYKFCAELSVTVSDTLDVQFSVINRDEKTFTITEALHTYFRISHVDSVKVTGLEGCSFIDQLDHDKEKLQQGAIKIKAEVDRIYQNSVDTCTICDEGLRRNIIVSKTDSKSTVVWNPWIQKSAAMADFDEGGYQHMVCVESANIGDHQITLKPGERHMMKLNISESSSLET